MRFVRYTMVWVLLLVPVVLWGQTTYRTHIVSADETAYSLARDAGISLEEFYRLNPGTEAGIRIGQKLKLPQTPPPRKPIGDKEMHTVMSGETFYAIARLYNISPAALRKLNPEIDPDVLKPGMEIRIAVPTSEKRSPGQKPGIVALSESETQAVEVALLLPIEGDGPKRYIHFYEGFLLGLYQLKHQGVSCRLTVHAVPHAQALTQLIAEGKLRQSHLVIGGASAAEVSHLVRYTAKLGITYVSPFISDDAAKDAYSPTFFRLNLDQSELYPYVGYSFQLNYKNHQMIEVSAPGGNHTAVTKALAHSRNEYKQPAPIRTSLTELPVTLASLGNQKVVVVPDDGSRQMLEGILNVLEKHPAKDVTLFGYPEWQSYGGELLKRVAAFRGTFYSSFYFDKSLRESRGFERNYQQFYSRSLDDTYPKYSLLGYDVSRFFIRALAMYGSTFTESMVQLPSDGLQNDFVFRQLHGAESFGNVNLFFITLDPTGHAKRRKMVF